MHIYGIELCKGLWKTCNVPQGVYKYSCSVLHDSCVTPSLVCADVSHEGYMFCGMFNVFLMWWCLTLHSFVVEEER